MQELIGSLANLGTRLTACSKCHQLKLHLAALQSAMCQTQLHTCAYQYRVLAEYATGSAPEELSTPQLRHPHSHSSVHCYKTSIDATQVSYACCVEVLLKVSKSL